MKQVLNGRLYEWGQCVCGAGEFRITLGISSEDSTEETPELTLGVTLLGAPCFLCLWNFIQVDFFLNCDVEKMNW